MSYISSLNLLLDESPVPINEEALREELSLWANAQFTFDTEPGSAVYDDSFKQNQFLPTLTHSNKDIKDDIDQLVSSYIDTNQFLVPNIPPATKNKTHTPITSNALPTLLPRIAPAPSPHTTLIPLDQNVQITPQKKRKFQPVVNNEDQDAIEDKRRRNTAASARFRMKKKQREQALEETAKAMTQKADALEERVIELEKEAAWLRALVVEKDPSLLNNSLRQ